MKQRNHVIDLLRFIAATCVVLFHLNESIPYINNVYRNVVKFGWLGVPIFFVISGYCIAQSASRSKNGIDFLVRRFFRIFPPYWFSLLVVFASIVIYTLIFGNNSVAVLPKSPISIAATTLLLTTPFSKIPTINWVYWSLTVEFFFYGVVAISLAFKQKLFKVFLLFISVFTFFPIIRNINIFFFLNHWAAFGIGLSLFYFDLRNKGAYVFSILMFLLNITNLFYLEKSSSYTVTVLITFALVFISIWVKDIPKSFLSQLGDCSYAVYLIHVPLGVYLLGQLKVTFVQKNPFTNILFDVMTYIIIVFLAHLTYKWIEQPSIRLGKLLMERKPYQLLSSFRYAKHRKITL